MNARKQRNERLRARKKFLKAAQAAAMRNKINGCIQRALSKADALCSSGCREVVNTCQVVRGYVELYDYYEPCTFPWRYIWGKIKKMERIARRHA